MKRSSATVLIIIILVMLGSLIGNAQTPRYITHQGVLSNASGAPYDTTIDMTFKFFTTLTNGVAAYSQTITNVQVSSGIFNVTIGPISLAFDKQYYLEVQAGSEVLSPRQQLTSSAYSLGPWSTNNNDVYYSFGNVGIGTNTPDTKFDVRGNARLGDGVSSEQDINFISANGNWEVGSNNSGNGNNNNQFYIYDGSTSSYLITAQKGTGNVGIGTNSPTSRLTVNGNLSSTSLSTGSISASSLSLSTFSASTVSASSYMSAPAFYPSSNHILKYGNVGTLAGQAGFDFNPGSSQNGIILESGESEGGGFYADGDVAVIWSPGDPDLLRVYDEDGMVLKWQLDGSGNASTVSDVRLKDNISTLSNALDKVTKIRGVDYNYKHNKEEQTKIASGKMEAETKKSLGFIAQELEQIVPEAVNTDKTTGYKTVAYDMIIPLLVEAVKEQQKEIEKLRALLENK